MRNGNTFGTLGALCALLSLSGCGGAVLYEPLPPASNALPDTARSTAGIEDYLRPGSGIWLVDLDGKVQTIDYGSADLDDALVYDADTDEWIVNIDGRSFYLTTNGAGGYDNFPYCATECVEFEVYDDNPYASQYGVFGYVAYDGPGNFVDYYIHAGLKTPRDAMPVGGSAQYTGVFEGAVNYTDAGVGADYDYIAGDAVIDADFTATGGSVYFSSVGTGDYAGSSYSLSGEAEIVANRYEGSVSGWYDDGASVNEPSLVLEADGGSLSGAFYGPAAEETAGVVYATSAPDDPYWGELAGGFWAAR